MRNKKLENVLKKVKECMGDIPFWFSGGQVLGYIREKGFLNNEHDIDLGIFAEDLPKLWDLLSKRFDVIKTLDAPKGKIIFRPIDGTDIIRVVKMEIDGVGVDIFVYHLWNGKRYAITSDNKTKHQYHSFPAYLFDNLKEIDFFGEKYSIPNPPEKYLELEYGDWETPVKEWSCCIHPPCLVKKILIGGTFDLFHIGHLRLLKRAREYGEIIYVGLLTDEACKRWKREPVIPYEQRKEIVSQFAEIVLPQNDVDEVKCGLIQEVNPDVIVHGDDFKPNSYNWAIKNNKKVVLLPYTKETNTSQIIKKIKENII